MLRSGSGSGVSWLLAGRFVCGAIGGLILMSRGIWIMGTFVSLVCGLARPMLVAIGLRVGRCRLGFAG